MKDIEVLALMIDEGNRHLNMQMTKLHETRRNFVITVLDMVKDYLDLSDDELQPKADEINKFFNHIVAERIQYLESKKLMLQELEKEVLKRAKIPVSTDTDVTPATNETSTANETTVVDETSDVGASNVERTS